MGEAITTYGEVVALVAVVTRIDFSDRDVVFEAFVVHVDVMILCIVSVSMATLRWLGKGRTNHQ